MVRVMSFLEQTPRLYTRSAIESVNPGQMGVYGILKRGAWIYVGSGDIRTRMLAHFHGDNPDINRETPRYWVSEITTRYIEREKELIVEHTPVCNSEKLVTARWDQVEGTG